MSMAEEDTKKQKFEDEIKRGRELIAAIRKEYDAQNLIRAEYTKISRALLEAEKMELKFMCMSLGKVTVPLKLWRTNGVPIFHPNIII